MIKWCEGNWFGSVIGTVHEDGGARRSHEQSWE
ncbi:hypothetical protein A2U01_0100002, partial [Trifolium medium]|nr:hypothetical protein [Trifolium medium]